MERLKLEAPVSTKCARTMSGMLGGRRPRVRGGGGGIKKRNEHRGEELGERGHW